MHLTCAKKTVVRAWLLALIAPVLTTMLCLALVDHVPMPSLALLYLASVLVVAISSASTEALVSAVLSFLAYDFFFTQPRFSLYILHREDLITASVLILVALLTGHLAARSREQIIALQTTVLWNKHQLKVAESLSKALNAQEVVLIFSQALETLFSSTLVRVSQKTLQVSPTRQDLRMRQVLMKSSGSNVSIEFAGLNTAEMQAELFELTPKPSDPQLLRVQALIELSKMALDRLSLARQLSEETQVKEREQLRTALLSSISHDLRTPLATMIGSVSTLLDLRDSLSGEQEQELLNNTLSEARRLDRYIQKLLDMTKVGSGDLKLDRDWVGVDEMISVSLKRLQPLLSGQEIHVVLDDNLPLVWVHGALIEQAIFNVLENAARYTKPADSIVVAARESEGRIEIDIQDGGPGIAPELWDQIFEMFFTLSKGDQETGGTGLGLAICQGVLGAHGGKALVVSSSAQSGTLIRLQIPLNSEKVMPNGALVSN